MRIRWMVSVVFLSSASVLADENTAKQAALDPAVAKEAAAAIDRAVAYLRKVQNADGSFGDGDVKTPITALVTAGVLRGSDVGPQDPMVSKALAFLEGKVQEDGGIEGPGGTRNYATAICVLAFTAANKDGRYQPIIDKAVAYLKGEQWDEGEGITPASPKYGGAGYGRKSRPDLSNTSFMLEALDAAGIPKDDPAYQRAMVFIRRCQNLSGEGANDLPQGKLIEDGGFYYTPAEDYNPGGGGLGQGLRSYGSMTYAGLKSFIHAGLEKHDPRVQAALGWIKKHYSLDENPGLGEQGLFYYYHTFAKALALLDLDTFVDESGKAHDWRADLVGELVERQRPDGAWANSNARWMEGDPRLVTAYVLLALASAVK